MTQQVRTGKRLPRLLVRGCLAMLIALCAVAALQLFDRGRVLTVKTIVRAERAWERDFPIERARRFARALDPLMARIGLLRPVRVEVEPRVNLLLDPLDDISRTILISRTATWEPEVWDAISSHLVSGGVFLDVGAHIGYDSLKAAALVGATGRVVAFEPNPATVAQLASNVEASGRDNVIIQPIACTDEEQVLTLFDSTGGGNSGSSSLSEANAGSAARPYTVKGRPIDDVVEELGLDRVDVLKADVEGAELMVLRGASDTLRRFHPALILEVVPRQLANMETSVAELEAFIRSHGYNSVRLVDYKNREYSVK